MDRALDDAVPGRANRKKQRKWELFEEAALSVKVRSQFRERRTPLLCDLAGMVPVSAGASVEHEQHMLVLVFGVLVVPTRPSRLLLLFRGCGLP